VQPAPHHYWNIEVPPNGLVPLPKAVDFIAGLDYLGKKETDLNSSSRGFRETQKTTCMLRGFVAEPFDQNSNEME
jgi:hypothetical protein